MKDDLIIQSHIGLGDILIFRYLLEYFSDVFRNIYIIPSWDIMSLKNNSQKFYDFIKTILYTTYNIKNIKIIEEKEKEKIINENTIKNVKTFIIRGTAIELIKILKDRFKIDINKEILYLKKDFYLNNFFFIDDNSLYSILSQNIINNNYIVITSKIRGFNKKNFNEIKNDFIKTIQKISKKYPIVLLGERIIDEFEYKNPYNINTIYTIYDDIKNNIDYIDLTTDELLFNPDIEIFKRDCTILSKSLATIGFGNGGNIWMSIFSSQQTINLVIAPDFIQNNLMIALNKKYKIYSINEKEKFKNYILSLR